MPSKPRSSSQQSTSGFQPIEVEFAPTSPPIVREVAVPTPSKPARPATQKEN